MQAYDIVICIKYEFNDCQTIRLLFLLFGFIILILDQPTRQAHGPTSCLDAKRHNAANRVGVQSEQCVHSVKNYRPSASRCVLKTIQ